MKSIRRFRLSRQALKQAPRGSASSQQGDDVLLPPQTDVEFPLGPRLFRKREARGAAAEEHLIIRERPAETRAGERKDPGVEDDEDDMTGEDFADESEIKVISRSEWESSDRKAPQAPEIPMVEPSSVAAQEGAEAEASAGSGPDEPASTSSSDGVLVPEETQEHGPPAPDTGKPLRRGKQSVRRTPARGQTGRAAAVRGQFRPESPADRLNRYAMKVGTHSYVLIDDEGHPVKHSDRPKQS